MMGTDSRVMAGSSCLACLSPCNVCASWTKWTKRIRRDSMVRNDALRRLLRRKAMHHGLTVVRCVACRFTNERTRAREDAEDQSAGCQCQQREEPSAQARKTRGAQRVRGEPPAAPDRGQAQRDPRCGA